MQFSHICYAVKSNNFTGDKLLIFHQFHCEKLVNLLQIA